MKILSLLFLGLTLSADAFALSGTPNSCVDNVNNTTVEIGGTMTGLNGVTKCCNKNVLSNGELGDALWGSCAPGVAAGAFRANAIKIKK